MYLIISNVKLINSTEEIIVTLCRIHNAFEEIRAHLRTLSAAADVPIEPPEQKAICDSSVDIPGVIASGVPGGMFGILDLHIAGGYDALFCILLGKKPINKLGELWDAFPHGSIRPLTSGVSNEGINIARNVNKCI